MGGTGLGFLPVIICAGVSYSIADKAGIAPGVILGLLCKYAGYGFLGGLVSGYLVGYFSVWLLKSCKSTKMGRRIITTVNLTITWITDYRCFDEIYRRYSYFNADKCNYRNA